MKHILAVYDVDPVYAARFAEVVNQKEKIPFEVVAFSSIERLRAFAAEHPVKLLLLGEHVPAEEKESIRVEKVILLSDNGGKPVSPSVPCVYKYQSSDAIVRDVMTWYGESPGELPEVSGRGLAKVLGVYSPVGRCLKTSFALTMGKLLAQEERVLYLNLEEFSGLSVLMKEEYKSDSGKTLDIPIIILVNGNTASASEIMTGCLKDYGKATVVGTTTYGKGIVQNIMPLTDGSAIKFTIAKYYTPNGTDIHKKGIKPDVKVKMSDAQWKKAQTDEKADKQLKKAIELLEK